MMYSSQIITALAKPLPGQSSKGGSGTVERRVDPSTYVINLGREKMTVKVTEGALSIGQQVTVSARNDKLIITPAQVPTPTQASAQASVQASLPETDRSDVDSFTRRGMPQGRIPQGNIRADLESLIADLSVRPFQIEDAKKSELVFKTMEGKLSSLDKPLTSAASAALQALSVAAAAGDPVSDAAVQKTLSLIEQLRDKVPATPASPQSGRSVALQTPVAEGLHRFASVSEALEFLKPAPATSDAFARELENMIVKDGSVAVRTETYKNQDTVATIVTKEEVSRELEALPGRFTSRAFQSIPPAVFEQLLENRGEINLDQLKVLDEFAAEMRLPAASQRAGSRDAQEAALLQWLTTAYDARTPTASLSSLLPTFSASSIIDSLEEFALSASKLSGTLPPLPAAENFSITQGTVIDNTDRSKLLESIIRRLGFTLENTLATEGRLDGPSLKQQLLETSRTLQTGPSSSPAAAEIRAQQAFAKIADDFLAAARTQLAPLVSAAAEGAGSGAGGALRQDIEAALQKGFVELKALLDRLTGEANDLVRTLPEKLTVSSRSAINEFANDAAKRIEEQVTVLSRNLEAAVQKSAAQLSGLTNQTAADTAKRVETLLSELSHNSQGTVQKNAAELAKLLEPVARQVKEIAQARSFVPTPAVAEKSAAALQALINTFSGDSGKRIEALTSEISRNSQVTVQKNAAELTKLLEQVASQVKEIAQAQSRTSVSAQQSTEKSAEAIQKVITAFTGDMGKRIENLISEISRNTQGPVQKNAAELSKLLEQVANQVKEIAQSRTSVPPPAATQKSAAALQSAISTFTGGPGKRIDALITEISRNSQGTNLKNTAELAKLLELVKSDINEIAQARATTIETARTVPEKITSSLQSVINAFTGDTGKRIQTLLSELSRNGNDTIRNNTAQLAKLLEQVSSKADEFTRERPETADAVHATPEKSAATLQSVISIFTGDAGKRIDALINELSRNSQGTNQKNAIELAKILEQVAGQGKEIAQAQASAPVPTPAMTEKSAAALQSFINSFTGDSGKRIEDLINEISSNSQGTVQKNAAELARLLQQVADQAKEIPQAQTRASVPTPAMTEKSAAALQSVINTFTGDSGKRIEDLINEIAQNSRGQVNKDSTELAKLLREVADQAKEIPQAQTRASVPTPAMTEKSAAALQSVINTFIGDSGKRIEDLINEIAQNGRGRVQKDSTELAKLLREVADQAKEIPQAQTRASVPTTAMTEKSAAALQSVINTFTGDSGKRIEDLINEISSNSQGTVQKNAAELAKILEQVAGQVKETPQPPISVPTPAMNEKSMAALQSVINTFTGDPGKRIEDLINKISRSSQGQVQKNAAELAGMFERIKSDATEVVQNQPASANASQQQQEKLTALLQSVIDTFTGDTGKRVNALIGQISQNSQGQKNTVELSTLLNLLSKEANDLVPAKISAPVLAALHTFSNDAGKLIDAMRQNILQNGDLPQKNTADAAKFLNSPTDGLNSLALTAQTQLRALPEKLAVSLQSAINKIMGDAGKFIETMKSYASVENEETTLQKNAADFAGALDRLAVESKDMPPSSRQEAISFVNDAGKRMEITMKQLLLDNEETLQKAFTGLSKFLDKLAGETESFARTLSSKLAMYSDSTIAALKNVPDNLLTTLLEEPQHDNGAAQGKTSGEFSKPLQLPASEAARTLPARLSALLQSAIDTFTGEMGNRIESLQRELSRDNGGTLQKSVKELSMFLKQVTDDAGGLIHERSTGTAAAGTVTTARSNYAAGPFTGNAGDSREPLSQRVLPDNGPLQQKSGGAQPQSVSSSDELARAVRGLPEKLIAALRSAAAAFADQAGKNSGARFRELSHQLEQQIKQGPSSLAGQASEATAGKKAAETRAVATTALLNTLQTALEKDLPALSQKMDEMKPLINRTTETLFRELLHDRNNPSAAQAKAEDALKDALKDALSAKDDQSLVRQTVRQNVETLLNRFESLQILARQVQNPEGEQQQIIAVPIKVGTEWTEMNVRFVNKKRKGGGGAEGHYTVYLNVAPALLGAIGATMEYTKDKNLSIAMHFEHHATRQWFAANKNELSATIGALGLPSPRITLFMERKARSVAEGAPASASGIPAAGTSSSLFDVKA